MDHVIQIITETFQPESIFLYGSKARKDSLPNSYYEIGVIFKNENYISRSEIRKIITDSNFSIYPFRLDEVRNATLDTPFQKKIYVRDICSSGRTLWGEKIIETMEKPKIELLDVLQDIRFQL